MDKPRSEQSAMEISEKDARNALAEEETDKRIQSCICGTFGGAVFAVFVLSISFILHTTQRCCVRKGRSTAHPRVKPTVSKNNQDEEH
mmetsp:Transcript_10517/g.14533  ORF Transcript_10517/g.14533 Transcript_10517/m.14533 type:complete len:88 (-) Transcript_10517:659-922(-)